jgi:hypothetical protein
MKGNLSLRMRPRRMLKSMLRHTEKNKRAQQQ